MKTDNHLLRLAFSLLLGVLILVSLLPVARPAQALSTDIVISQVYGGGGNSGALYTNDFVEIFNRGSSSVNITGWSVQYASATGSGNFGTNPVTLLSGTLAPGQYYLVQLASGGANGVALPTPDAIGTVNMSGVGGKVALVMSTTGLGCNGGSTICSAAQLALIKDLVGWDGANFYETAPAPATTNSTAALRLANGCTETDNNALDFAAGTPTPRNTSSPLNPCIASDTPPTVADTFPVNGATDFPINANLTVTFSEPVNLGSSWFEVTCTSSGTHSASTSGGPTSFTLDPDSDFAAGESCTVTVFAAQVSDQDLNDPPDNMAADFSWSFSTQAVNVCELAYTPAYAIQGSGLSAAITGSVTTQGVVVGDFEGPTPTLRGFYLQDLSGDGDPATSDAIFVFNGNNDNVNLGNVVRVSGSAGEFQDQTQISSVSAITSCGSGSVAPVDVTLPVSSATYLERFEGMLVRLPQTLYVTEHFQLGRFGQVVVSSGGRLHQPTSVTTPGAPANALQAQNDLNRLIIDDALNNQNPDPILFARNGNPLSAGNTLRGGDTAKDIVGVLTYTWAGNAASGNAYRLRPVNALGGGVPNFQAANPRPASAPAVGGSLKVVGMNLLNFFNTFDGLPDLVDNCTNGVNGSATDCRGADTQAEFDRQWPKIIAAILAMDPHVLGVNEIENDGYGSTSALHFLVDRLNDATAPGTYAFIDADANTGQTNALGTDAIKVALIYQPAKVTPVGQTAALNTVAFVNGGDSAPRNRASLAQAFRVNATGGVFIANVNHLKSKGSACEAPDAGDGQGNCNLVRVNAANQLLAWFATDPTGTGDPDILLIGDYNAYAREDPIAALEAGGFTNLIASLLGPQAYSYVFDGQWGYMDHALASASLVSQVKDVADYHINSDEPSVLDYNTDFKSPGQITSLYAPDQFRVSDHDPVMVGLEVNVPPTVDAGGPYTVSEGGSVTVSATGSDPNGDPLTYAWDLDTNGSFETPGQSVTFSAGDLDGPGSSLIRVQATDPGGLSAKSFATVNIVNADPSAGTSPATQFVQYSDPLAEVTVTGSDVSADLPLSITSQWNLDSGSFTSGLPAGLSLGAASCGSNTCTWTLSGTILAAPGTYTVRFTLADKDGGSATTDHTLTVTQEDARATYIGALYVSTASTSSNSANVTLAATVQDISITPDAAGDLWPGDIRNATVTFVDRDTNKAITGCSNLPVGLVYPNDLQTGAASCSWSATISGDAQSFNVGIVVNNYYTRDATADDVVVLVAKPLASNLISGGGYLVLVDPAGEKAGDPGSKANFGFNVKYNKKGTNLQGQINLILRRTEADGLHVYQIKGNALTSLAVQPGPGTATFNGKASIQDITNALAPVSVEGNASLQVTMDNNGEPGTSDTIGITVWNKNGGLWFSSRWDGSRTLEQLLERGNLQVK